MIKNITDSEYFSYGSAFPSYEDGPSRQFALYEPITDRFVLVDKEHKNLTEVSNLFSSRLSLQLCELSSASNFTSDLIDNTCCLDWTIADKSELSVALKIHDAMAQKPFCVSLLGDATPADQSELIIQNLEYLMAVHTWLEFNDKSFHQNHVDPFWGTELRICNDIELPFGLSPGAEIINKIKSIIYNEWDFQLAEEQIKAIYAEAI